MTVSRVAFGSLIVATVLSAMGCRVEVETKTRYVEDNVSREDTADWTGQPIKIQIEGVGISKNGGVEVVAVPGATKVAANARMLAMAFSEEKANADQSIIDAKATFQITNTPSGITIFCGHGQTHGSSTAGESGCELVKITIPAGDAQQPLSLEVLGGNGPMTLSLADASIKNLGVNNQDDITARMPSTWAADSIILQADEGSITNNVGGLTLTRATDGTNQSTGTFGTAGTGLASLKVTSKEFAGSTGSITLQ